MVNHKAELSLGAREMEWESPSRFHKSIVVFNAFNGGEESTFAKALSGNVEKTLRESI